MKIKKKYFYITTYIQIVDISTNNDFFLYLSDYTCDFPDAKCSNGLKCVNYLHLCDGFNHCDDGSDETLKMCTGKLSILFSLIYPYLGSLSNDVIKNLNLKNIRWQWFCQQTNFIGCSCSILTKCFSMICNVDCLCIFINLGQSMIGIENCVSSPARLPTALSKI